MNCKDGHPNGVSPVLRLAIRSAPHFGLFDAVEAQVALYVQYVDKIDRTKTHLSEDRREVRALHAESLAKGHRDAQA